MLADELLDVLACPETRQPLRVADEAQMAALNEAVAAGRVRNRAGDPVGSPLDGGLVRKDGRLLYPIRDGIPIMLLDEAIVLDDPGETADGP